MERIERNEPFKIQIDDIDRIMDKLDQLFTRLSLSLLVSAIFIGVAFLIPSASPNNWGLWMIIGGLVALICLGIWWLISFLRPRHK